MKPGPCPGSDSIFLKRWNRGSEASGAIDSFESRLQGQSQTSSERRQMDDSLGVAVELPNRETRLKSFAQISWTRCE
jgi:hypothetical protein